MIEMTQYDAHAEAFAEAAPKFIPWRYVSSKAFDRAIDYSPEITILDHGSGSGILEGHFIEQGVPPENITGIEISTKQLELAKKRVPGPTYIEGDITTRMFEPQFDYVVSHMVYEHLDNTQLALAMINAYRALKPGGKLFYVVTHPWKMMQQGHRQEGWFSTSAPWGGEINNFFRGVNTFMDLTEGPGFKIKNVESLAITPEVAEEDQKAFDKYNNYQFIRLAITAVKP